MLQQATSATNHQQLRQNGANKMILWLVIRLHTRLDPKKRILSTNFRHRSLVNHLYRYQEHHRVLLLHICLLISPLLPAHNHMLKVPLINAKIFRVTKDPSLECFVERVEYLEPSYLTRFIVTMYDQLGVPDTPERV